MSFYVAHTHPERARRSWVGPIRSERQAHREREAWEDAGHLDCAVLPSTPEIRAEVRSWQRLRDAERAVLS